MALLARREAIVAERYGGRLWLLRDDGGCTEMFILEEDLPKSSRDGGLTVRNTLAALGIAGQSGKTSAEEFFTGSPPSHRIAILLSK